MQDTKETNPNIMYNQVKRKISGVIEENKNLQEDTIKELVAEWKALISSTPPKFLKTILSIQDENIIHNLTEDEWKYMQYELEQTFDVRITTGILVTGEDQKSRDLTWWTSKRKLEGDNYYSNNYFNYMKHSLPPQVLETIDEDTDAIMNNLANPESEVFSRYGMVVGHVQSGKTSNYASLICKAADAGYRFIVVIAGGQNNLRDQTQSRLDEVFVGANYQGVGKLAGFKREKMPDSLTNATNDFKIETARARETTNFENMQLPILVVIKKHTKTLTHLLEWLNTHYKNQVDKAMLVIDDESDYASINTKDEDHPTVINGKIRLLLQKFKKSAYVAYTATPYANIFIDHKAENIESGKDLFPSDFIYALDAPTNYFGAEKIFIKNNDDHVIKIPESEVVYEIDEGTTYLNRNLPFSIKHKKEYHLDLEELPDSLYDAIRLFIINIAIRDLRKQSNHNSMLIHISRFTDVHVKIRKLVSDYFKGMKNDVDTYGGTRNPYKYSENLTALRDTFNNRLKNIEFDFEQILRKICSIISTVEIKDVHQSSKIPFEYRDDRQTNAIVIGGLSLSRGFTLEGLSVSYFLRTTIYYDTLMQMGRWFGYRVGYEDLCRVYLTKDINEKFGFIIEATNDLISRLKDMRDENLTPADFGLSVKLHPDSLLQVTARNKSQNTEDMYLEMNLDGQIKETRWISSLQNDLDSNDNLLKRTVNSLDNGVYAHTLNKSHLWTDVDKGIIEDFVRDYKLYRNDPLGLKSRMPIDFIKKYIKECDLKWDVVLYNGSNEDIFQVNSVRVNRQLRKVKVKKGYYEVANRQLSRANPEKIVMTEENKNLSSRDMRSALEKPLLMLHSLKLKDENGNEIDGVGFGISFPAKKGPFNKSVKVRINSVYKKQLDEAYKDGGDSDFEYE
ncbi:Z1 domain-containing protein [Rossellomorea marisflavi]|uniref:Z1 domain-containing protein n=1 Tax=Rossellomorea marisflavi TaxID=189381 RepID=UPI00064FB7E9|nr:Z1 domain-containing protein [Rossellomorea marisflavi]KMK95066.1 endonuclease [Rossellomorea marisflavi]